MKIHIFLIAILSLCATSWAGSKKLGYMVSVDSSSACAIDDNGVQCWGYGSYANRVPALKNIQQISKGLYEACALADGGVQCWGREESEILVVPALNQPKEVSVGSDTACAIDEDGIICWGSFWNKKTTWKVQGARGLSVGTDYSCAIIGSNVECWGTNFSKPSVSSPPLKNPRKVVVNTNACAIDDTGVVCWDWSPFIKPKFEVPPLKNVKDLDVGVETFCALDDEGVKCWGDRSITSSNSMPILINPYQISVGFLSACALDDEGLKCWIYGNPGMRDVVTKMPPLSFYKVFDFKSYLPSVRAVYFKPFELLEKSASKNIRDRFEYIQRAYFLNALQAPNILSIDSAVFQERIIPAWQSRLKRWEDYLGYAGMSEGLLLSPDDIFTRTAALVSIQSALSVSLNFLAPDEQVNIQEALRVLGQAMSNPMDHRNVKSVILKLDHLQTEKEKLKASSRTAFLADSMELAASWLKEQVK